MPKLDAMNGKLPIDDKIGEQYIPHHYYRFRDARGNIVVKYYTVGEALHMVKDCGWLMLEVIG